MYRLRSNRLRANVLPLLLAALVFRAFIPAGFMFGSGDGTSLSVSMCSTQAGKTETLEIPGEHAKPHCEYCLAPLLGAPQAFLSAGFTAAAQHPTLAPLVSQLADSPLARAQAARGPPHA